MHLYMLESRRERAEKNEEPPVKHTIITNGGISVKDTGRHPAREARIERDTAPSTRLLVNWKIRENE